MSFLTNIFSQAPAPAPVVPSQQGNIPDAPTVVTDPNNPASPVTPVVPVEPESPLDSFKDLWQTAPVDPNAPVAPTGPVALNPEDVQKAVAKADFSQFVTPEQLAAISEGGEGASTAFLAAMNAVGRQSLAQATLVNNKLNAKNIEDALAAHMAKLPDMIKSQASTDHLKTSNPLFDNPAVKPVIEATHAQLAIKFPNATNAELTKMTHDYVTAMGQSFAPPAPVPASEQGQDWDVFLQS